MRENRTYGIDEGEGKSNQAFLLLYSTASERRFYQKISDLYALSADYNKGAEITKVFFASVQNKLHWAITGKTAAEIVYTEADTAKIYMGLKIWKQAPNG